MTPTSDLPASQAPKWRFDFREGPAGTVRETPRSCRTVLRRSDLRGGSVGCTTVRTNHAGPIAALWRGKLRRGFKMNKVTHLLMAGAVALGSATWALRKRRPRTRPAAQPPTSKPSPAQCGARNFRPACPRCQAVRTPALEEGSCRRYPSRATSQRRCTGRPRRPGRRGRSPANRCSLFRRATRCSIPRCFRPRAGLAARRCRSSSRTSSARWVTLCRTGPAGSRPPWCLAPPHWIGPCPPAFSRVTVFRPGLANSWSNYRYLEPWAARVRTDRLPP